MTLDAPIIVGADHGCGSRAALAQAGRLAALLGRGLIAVRVAELPYNIAMMEGYAIRPVDLHKAAREEGETDLELALASVPGMIHANRHVCLGSIAPELNRFARETRASLLVIGMNRDDQADTIGVIASQCVRAASLPVLLVASSQTGPFRQILACIDFSGVSIEVVQAAARWAERDMAQLTVMHVHHPKRAPSVEHAIEDGPDICENLHRHLHRFWLDHKPNAVPPEFVVIEHERADKAINEYAVKHGVDLAVLGTGGRWSLHDRILGTTAERMLRNSTTSLLAIPPHQERAVDHS